MVNNSNLWGFFLWASSTLIEGLIVYLDFATYKDYKSVSKTRRKSVKLKLDIQSEAAYIENSFLAFSPQCSEYGCSREVGRLGGGGGGKTTMIF